MALWTQLGYDVVVSLVDGPSSNVKFYKKKLCADKLISVTLYPVHFSNLDFNGSSLIVR